MTDATYTHIHVLLDESGSMMGLVDDTIGGFNAFLAEQQSIEGKVTMTVVKFSSGKDSYQVLTSMTPLDGVPPLSRDTYRPGSGTALLDATGKSIIDLGNSLSKLEESARPGKVLFMIITDGAENSSVEFSKEKISTMVKTQEDVYKWTFLYLGANVDAFQESSALGIRGANAVSYTASGAGLHATYNVMSRSVGAVRGLSGQDVSYSIFSAEHVDDLESVDFAERLASQVESPESKS